MYDLLGTLIDAIERTPRATSDDVCAQVEAAIEGAGLVRHDYMATLDALDVDDPWEAPVERLDRDGVIAVISFVHRSQRWRGTAYADALESGLLLRMLRRLRELDAPAVEDSLSVPGEGPAVDLGWLQMTDSQDVRELVGRLVREDRTGGEAQLGERDVATVAQGVGRAVSDLRDSLAGQESEDLMNIVARVALGAYEQGVRDTAAGTLSPEGCRVIGCGAASDDSLEEPSSPC